jgi:hypothetical protein
MSKAFKPAKQSGTQLADSIRASGHEQGRINRPDTRLHPTNVTTSNRHLQCGSHPHRTLADGLLTASYSRGSTGSLSIASTPNTH